MFSSLSLNIENSEKVAILGGSGEGKTSLIRALLSLAEIEGKIVDKPKFSVVFQEDRLVDELSAKDIAAYNRMLNTLSHRELICGFLSGKKEILSWEPSDLFQFYYDTKPIQGSLNELLPLLDATAVIRSIKIGACNIYHGCVHNMLYEKDKDILKGLYKSASFVIQSIAFQQTGSYIARQEDLLPVVAAEERRIVDTFLTLKNGGAVEFESMSEALFVWSKNQIGQSNCVYAKE